jgi:uncharacterized protein YhbP (UPF0306 family)
MIARNINNRQCVYVTLLMTAMEKSIVNVEQAIRDYLPETVHLSLATSRDNKPWVCEVHFVYDDHLNLYFRSLFSRRHSQEIVINPHVSGNIVAQHKLDQNVRGVYFEGIASMLKDQQEIQNAYQLFVHRLHVSPDILAEAEREDGHKFFRISVQTYYLFDSRSSSPARKYELKWS